MNITEDEIDRIIFFLKIVIVLAVIISLLGLVIIMLLLGKEHLGIYESISEINCCEKLMSMQYHIYGIGILFIPWFIIDFFRELKWDWQYRIALGIFGITHWFIVSCFFAYYAEWQGALEIFSKFGIHAPEFNSIKELVFYIGGVEIKAGYIFCMVGFGIPITIKIIEELLKKGTKKDKLRRISLIQIILPLLLLVGTACIILVGYSLHREEVDTCIEERYTQCCTAIDWGIGEDMWIRSVEFNICLIKLEKWIIVGGIIWLITGLEIHNSMEKIEKECSDNK